MAEILAEIAPELRVGLSSDVLPEFKEFERMSTTVINAYVMPIVEGYLRRIVHGLADMGVDAGLNIMQSDGGVMSAEMAGRRSVHTVLSDPAAGVLGAMEQARMAEMDDIIIIDMGGTSFDVSLVHRGAPTFTSESDIGGHPVKVPMIDIKTLGAGGGSIAWVDPGGALQVGPESAGADPGPSCYGRGGTAPTVTDANMVLGYLETGTFAAGEMSLDAGRARKAISEKIAGPMDLGVEEAAEGILRVVNATMIRGIRLVSVEKGHDPREFALVCFGGAGPVHAVKLAQELGIPTVMVPEGAGVNCAMGLLMADYRQDHSRTFLHRLAHLDAKRLAEAYDDLETQAAEQMIGQGVAQPDIVFHRSADMRFLG